MRVLRLAGSVRVASARLLPQDLGGGEGVSRADEEVRARGNLGEAGVQDAKDR